MEIIIGVFISHGLQLINSLYLVRVVVELTAPLTIVTVYRTSKIEKYWSEE